MYGAQTMDEVRKNRLLFENDVEMYGAQTPNFCFMRSVVFENDVEMYGAQTLLTLRKLAHCLRMM